MSFKWATNLEIMYLFFIVIYIDYRLKTHRVNAFLYRPPPTHRRTHRHCGSAQSVTHSPLGFSPSRPTDTTHICRSARASGSRRTSSTSTTPSCSSSASPRNSRSAWTPGEGAARATSTSSPTSSTPCSTSSTRTLRRCVSLAAVAVARLGSAHPCPPVFSPLAAPRTRATSREEKNLQSFQEQPSEKWVESSYEVEGPHYYTVLAMHIMPPERWRSSRIYFLRRLLVSAHTRKISASTTNK